MRVALFGATGFVGSHIVDALIAEGIEPSVLIRSGSEHKLCQPKKCRVIVGSLSSKSNIETTLEGCSAVIYCIGILRELPDEGANFEELQYNAVVRVADCAKTNGIGRFLLMSANGAKSPGTPYQDTKFRAERYVRSTGLDTTVFRPSVIFGNPRGRIEIATQLLRDMVNQPAPAIAFFMGFPPFTRDVLLSPVHISDVANAFIATIKDESTIGKTYALGGPEVLSWGEMLKRIGQAVERKKLILPMPIAFAYLAATLFDRFSFFPATRDQLKMLAEGNTTECTELAALTGSLPKRFTPEFLDYLRDSIDEEAQTV